MKRAKHSLSHYKLLTGDMGLLYPVTWYEALPGDSIQHSTSALLRVSPLLAPVMHPVRVRFHHWFVPIRLIWEDFEDFITGGPDGTSIPYPPKVTKSAETEGSIFDYLGLPPGTYGGNIDVCVLSLRAYQLIWNTYYRDQDLSTEAVISLASGTDSTTSTTIQRVAWEKDYFTTARPWEQKGTEVTIPLTGDAPITGLGAKTQTWASGPQTAYETDGTGGVSYADYKESDAAANQQILMEEDPNNAGFPNVRADLSAVSGVNINDLRLALAIQRYQEARAQYGSRYVEYLRYLGVRSSDARLQNPEYLGGGTNVVQFSEVLSTDSGGSDPVGDMKGHGIAAMRTNKFRRFFEEHGIVMTTMSVVPKAVYTQGIDKKWTRFAKEQYFQKELQYLGDESVIEYEINAMNTTPDGIFGYQSRYDSYRSVQSGIAGEFNSTLDHWHYGRQFAGDVALNSSFVEATPTKRVNASTGTDCLYVMTNHSVQARRPVAKNPKPKTF